MADIRLGGPIPKESYTDPASWVVAVRAKGYRAAVCPVGLEADAGTIRAYAQAAADADIVIAEVGAWSNPISPDPATRSAAFEKCVGSLALADEIGARCCVNIAGSCSDRWDGPHPDNLTPATFDLIVETTQAIIDAVQPTRTLFALETMPWAYPDSPESYARLVDAIDRPAFGVHLDPVNLVNSPSRYFANGALIQDCFRQMGARIVSCHAKDILLHPKWTVHLDEVRPGLGGLDYAVYLRGLAALGRDIPLILEHLPSQDEYALAAAFVRGVAQKEGIDL